MGIDNKAMIVKLHISAWKGRMTDKEVTTKTNTDYGASSKAGVYNKFLISKDELAKIQLAESNARKFHMDMTLPWKDGGDRMLPAKNFMRYNKGMRDRKQKFDSAVTTFLNQYPVLITSAQQVLGSMYKKAEYPTPSHMQTLFRFFTDIQPIPVSGDFRVELNQHEIAKIKKDIDESNKKSNEDAMTHLRNRLYDAVKTMANGMRTKLDQDGKILKKGRVFDSYVDNIRELTKILPDLNIDDDQVLNDLAIEISDTLAAHTPGQLRQDAALKKETVETADDIMARMDGYMGLGGGAVDVN